MSSGTIVLNCASLRAPTAATIDCIARLQLAVRRGGFELLLGNANQALLELIDFTGLAGVLRVESRWQAEQREQPCRVEKEGELDDPPDF
jgi:hypothetical protein